MGAVERVSGMAFERTFDRFLRVIPDHRWRFVAELAILMWLLSVNLLYYWQFRDLLWAWLARLGLTWR